MAYANPDDARKRDYIYLTKDEKQLLKEWAKINRAQKAALMRERLVAMAKQELERYQMRERIAGMAREELAKTA